MVYYVVLKSNGEILKYSVNKINHPFMWVIDMSFEYPISEIYLNYGIIQRRLKSFIRDERIKSILKNNI
jgi:hypothetical protein